MCCEPFKLQIILDMVCSEEKRGYYKSRADAFLIEEINKCGQNIHPHAIQRHARMLEIIEMCHQTSTKLQS